MKDYKIMITVSNDGKQLTREYVMNKNQITEHISENTLNNVNLLEEIIKVNDLQSKIIQLEGKVEIYFPEIDWEKSLIEGKRVELTPKQRQERLNSLGNPKIHE